MKKNFIACLIVAPILFLQTNILTAQVNVQDSLALVDFYNSTDGQNWTNHTNWLTTAPVSSWFGIIADATRVTEISFYNNGLNGSIPASFGKLTGLKKLSVTYGLTGTLPSSLGNLTALQSLYLVFNDGLTGSIPSSLGNLSNLQYLYLNSNHLNGTIPSSLGKLKQLIWLFLSDNKLSGEIPAALGNLPQLQVLDLTFNKLTGNIPGELSNDSNLRELDLGHNNLSGNIPASLGNLNLHELQLNSTNLSGTIPSSLTKLDVAAGIYINEAHFTFAGMEQMVKKFPFITYAPQASIKLNKNGNTFSVYAGGANALADNTYKWYKGSTLVATITGDSTFIPTQSGNYSVKVKNAVATELILYSDTLNYSLVDNLIASQINSKISSVCVYSNPAKSNATLSFYANGKYIINIADVSGKILQTKTGIAVKGTNIIQLDVSKYASGVYLITIADEKNTKQTLRLKKE